MAIYTIKTPDIGEGIAEVELVAWHVQPGDAVRVDQVLADVMTDKATVEVPCPVAGVVLALAGTVGQTVAVGSELVRLEVTGADNVATPVPAIQIRDDTAAATPQTKSVSTVSERPIASPAVRRRAWELGIDLNQVTPTGPSGRIVHADLDGYPQQPRTPHSANLGLAATDAQQHMPVIGLRRKIAIRMQDAKRRIPHFTYVEEVDVTEVETLRERLNEQWGERRGRLTLLPLLVRAMVLAARDYPQINARFDDEVGVVTRHAAVHVGIATQTDNGLMVPVLRQAQARSLWANHAEIVRLAQAARAGKATREELSGSTITLTSLGALGGIASTPIINHPEVAIVGVNRIVERPTVVRGAIVVRKVMNLSSSFDHRVVDGVDAARFVQAMRAYLELPATLFVE